MTRAMSAGKAQAVGDRRVAPRQEVAYRLDVIARGGGSGFLLDVSTTGMRVRFKPGVDVGSVQALRVEFPRWLELGAGLDVSGRIVWVRSPAGGGQEAGFAFDGLSRKEQSVLEVLIQRLSDAIREDGAELP
jgi:hypothetical protein